MLIAINVFVYLFLQPKTGIDLSGNSLDQSASSITAPSPNQLTHPGAHCELVHQGAAVVSNSHVKDHLPTWATALTAGSATAAFLHLGGNMRFLWIFGNNVEDSMGPVRFVIFYLLAGIAALALQTAINPDAAVPTLGASGAIAGVWAATSSSIRAPGC